MCERNARLENLRVTKVILRFVIARLAVYWAWLWGMPLVPRSNSNPAIPVRG